MCDRGRQQEESEYATNGTDASPGAQYDNSPDGAQKPVIQVIW